ncbi:MAG TPA: dienelactone hydrolase family protein [Candidatus Deferrimicrobiaceae bacterium]|nr:dienelactone hydrolase family protein [Candidatus Deferrimicrobiaceae bacterium]
MRAMIGILFFLFAIAASAHGEIRGEPVEYAAGGTTMKGYLAYDDAFSGKRPGILVVHEWWGHDEYARRRARMLASLGYVALAVDMYGEGKQAKHPDDAGKFSGEIRKNMALGRERFLAARAALEANRFTDPKRIGAVGYCFGGSVVLQMARDGMDLGGVASFHGGLTTEAPAKPGAVKAKILVLTGAEDKFIPPDQVAAFEQEMKSAGADFRVVSYPGALHSFTNPEADANGKKFNLPLGYHAEADQKSWEDMQTFFKDLFGK